MPRNKLHDAALAGDAGLVLKLIEESRQRRLKQAEAAENEARMAAIEAEARVRAIGGTASPSPPRLADHPSKKREAEAEAVSFIEANAADALGRTPLHIAAAQGSIGVVDALLQANCNHRLADKRGRTALMEAASYGHAPAVAALLYAAQTPAAQAKYATECDCAGWTALHDASYRGHVDIVITLLGPPVDPIWGTALGLQLLGCATAADGATVSGNSVGRLMTPRQLAEQYGQTEVLAAMDSWMEELERRRDVIALERRAATVAAHQRLALAASMHKMIASKLHHRRLYLPVAWRPTDLLLQAIAGYMPEQAADGPCSSVVQRFLREGFVWRSMQERRIHRVALYVAKDLEEDTSRRPRWGQDDPFDATVYPEFSRSPTNLPSGTDNERDTQLRLKVEADLLAREHIRDQSLVLGGAEQRHRQDDTEKVEEKQRLSDQTQQLASPFVSPNDTYPPGLLSCNVLAVAIVCAHVGSRVTSQSSSDLPYCDIALGLSAVESERAVEHRRTGRAKLETHLKLDDVAAHAQKKPVLVWGTVEDAGVEERFDISASIFEASSQRSVHLHVADVGMVEVDLRTAPTTSKRWKLRQWVELADQTGRHVASALMVIKWAPAPPLEQHMAQ
eukprot:COSAG02_NODE_62_length_43372_cov_14.404710_10_plen_622_part_00